MNATMGIEQLKRASLNSITRDLLTPEQLAQAEAAWEAEGRGKHKTPAKTWGWYVPGSHTITLRFGQQTRKIDLRPMSDYAQAHWAMMLNREDTHKTVEFEDDLGVTIYFYLREPKTMRAGGNYAGSITSSIA